MSASNEVRWVRLGDYIEKFSQKNKDGIPYVSGVNIFKEFIPTVADLNGTDISKYQVVPHGTFACNLMHIGRDAKIPIAFNYSEHSVVISPAYDTFRVPENKSDKILPDYLIMLFKCREIDRLSWFYCDSSIRGNLQWDRFCDIKIPLPSIEVQRELVSVYSGLKSLAEENEALLLPLSDACQAFIVDCKNKYPIVKLGEYIELSDKRNSGNEYGETSVRGISTNKELIDTKANLAGVSLSSYKLINPKEFVYVADTSRRGDKIALALNCSEQSYLVSSIYTTFRSKEGLMPEFLFLLLTRSEFDRYARFNSWGSARETFDWSEMCRVEIPLPPVDVQQKVVDLYNCYEEAKSIADQAREQLKTICPALVQKAAHTA